MSHLAIGTLLQEYKTQRKYRELKRNEFLRRFQVLKQTFSNIHQHHEHISHSSQEPIPQIHHHQPMQQIRREPVHVYSHQPHQHIHIEPRMVQVQHVNPSHSHQVEPEVHHHHNVVRTTQIAQPSEQEIEMMRENQLLKKTLIQIESEEKEKLHGFKVEIDNVRNKYMDEIKKLQETARNSKEQTESKMNKIKTQSEAAAKKNQQILLTNKQLKLQINQGNALMGTYATEIKKQYAQKIIEFEKIFNTSNEKIEAMEKEFNEDEFIENTLKNEELLKSIEQNAEKAQQAGKILQDYTALLQGKKQILAEINGNTQMKQKQIEKMIELQGKMKVIMDKLTQEKKIYVGENNKMAQQLIEIKSLLMGAINQSK